LLIGLVGAGKTTFAQKLWASHPQSTIRSSLDEIIQMVSFYDYEPKMSGFYTGVERSTIIDGLIDGYRVIVDRTNISRKVRKRFISLVAKLRDISMEYLHLLKEVKEDNFVRECEKSIIENILVEESREKISIYSSFLKLLRRWKAKRSQPDLFHQKGYIIREELKKILQTEVVGIYFGIPEDVCIERRLKDPYNIVRDRASEIDWKAVIKRMSKKLEPPSMDEGFDRLYIVNNRGKITKKT
jgi:predicted kinase